MSGRSAGGRRILVLEAYYGGSHRAFLDGWREHSRHAFTVLTLPARKWKWRMRHAGVTFAEQVAERVGVGERWEVVLTSDMTPVADWRSLAPRTVRDLPHVLYFHENQLTYPFRFMKERDFHFGFTNMTSALAADRVWFNSAYHRDDFLTALGTVLGQMPDYRLRDVPERIAARSEVRHPGIGRIAIGERREQGGPLHVVWAARWEHDKDPETFFAALGRLKEKGVPFRVSVVGERFRGQPEVFDVARKQFAAEVVRWGYQPSRSAYVAALQEADVIVSTARHEFFGLSVVEGIAAGCYPLLPPRLSYPELLAHLAGDAGEPFTYRGGAGMLARRLQRLSREKQLGRLDASCAALRRAVGRWFWEHRARELDDAVAELAVFNARGGRA